MVVNGGRVRVHHGPDVVAEHDEHAGRHVRVVNRAHLVGVNGGSRPAEAEAARPTPELLRPLDEYAAVAGGAFLMAGVDHDTLAGWLTRLQLTAIRDQLEMAFKVAHFPMIRELADFDFKAQPSVDRRQVRELATSRWVAHGDALLVLGPPGVGKSHLAIALGREAIRQSYSVLFTTAQALMAALVKAHSTITGESYRLREKRRAGALKIPAPKPPAPETRPQAST